MTCAIITVFVVFFNSPFCWTFSLQLHQKLKFSRRASVPPRMSTESTQVESANFQDCELSVSNILGKKRLDAYISETVSNYTRSFIADLCENKMALVNGKARDKSFKVGNGDLIKLRVPVMIDDSTVLPENIPLDILFEDNHIIVVNKPEGMVVHPAVGSPNGTFANALLFYLGDDAIKLFDETTQHVEATDINDAGDALDGQSDDVGIDLPETPEAAKATPRSLRPGIVHRLDKGTSGVLLAAKHSEAVSKLSALFAQREVEKTYLAICVGHPGEATIAEPIGRCTRNRQLMTVYDGPPGKLAVSHVRTIAFDGKLSACLVRIETGR